MPLSKRWPNAMSILVRYWNSVLAAGSLAAIAVFNFVPPLQEYIKPLLFVFATAITLVLLDIRMELDKDLASRKAQSFENMRAARTDILAKLREVIDKSGSELTEITIVGGRVRTITDILRDLAIEVRRGWLQGSNVLMRIYCLDPAYVRSWDLPGDLSAEKQKERNSSYAHMIDAAKREIVDIANSAAFSTRNIVIRVNYYDYLPTYYCYLLGGKFLYWGFYTWDKSCSDVIGPDNRCYFLSNTHPDFPSYYRWLQNWTQYVDARNEQRSVRQREEGQDGIYHGA